MRSIFARSEHREQSDLVNLNRFKKEIDRLVQLNELIETFSDEKKEIERVIKEAMGQREHGSCYNYEVAWTKIIGLRLDSSRLKKEEPETYKSFLREQETRRFTVKSA